MRRREINANYTVVAPAMVMMVLMKRRPEMVKRGWFFYWGKESVQPLTISKIGWPSEQSRFCHTPFLTWSCASRFLLF
jgi:hypothetical protein